MCRDKSKTGGGGEWNTPSHFGISMYRIFFIFCIMYITLYYVEFVYYCMFSSSGSIWTGSIWTVSEWFLGGVVLEVIGFSVTFSNRDGHNGSLDMIGIIRSIFPREFMTTGCFFLYPARGNNDGSRAILALLSKDYGICNSRKSPGHTVVSELLDFDKSIYFRVFYLHSQSDFIRDI